MGLRINSIELRDFRSYEEYKLDDIGDLTIFIGRNAIGKTNILESIQLVTSATSFRHPQILQLIRQGCQSGCVTINAADGNRDLTTELKLEAGKRRYFINGKPKKTADVRGLLPSVTFAPDDLELAKGSSSIKRRALDEVGIQLSRNYYVIAKDFEKALRYKNRLLKDEAHQSLIDAINDTLVTCGAQLFCYRFSLYRKMSHILSECYGDIVRTGEELELDYVPSWVFLKSNTERRIGSFASNEGHDVRPDAIRDTMFDALQEFGDQERIRHRALVGPHNDKMSFFIDGKDASQFASQGQQRSIVLAWKLAEVKMVRKTLGTEPILLLDDVMSELDSTRRDMLVENVTSETQTFITATDLSPFNEELVNRARVVDLESLAKSR